jgi:type II secretory pathway component PulF
MATFVYKAKKNSAETVTGRINARTQDEAVDLITQLGFLPVSIEAQPAPGEKNENLQGYTIAGRELYFFSKQLAHLLKSGVPLLRALHILEGQTQTPQLKKVVARLAWEIKHGQSLSESLALFPNAFPPLFVAMVHAGEEGSSLSEMMTQLAAYHKQQEDTRRKIRSALAYPTLMVMVGIITVVFVLLFVIPRMSGLFESMGQNLPLPTQLILSASSALKTSWTWILLGIGSIIVLGGRYAQTQRGRSSLSRFFLSLPLWGDVLLKSELARFSRTIALLLKSNIPIVRSLKIAVPMLENEVIKKHFSFCAQQLAAGGSLGATLQQCKDIPLVFGQLILVGEEAGSLENVLHEIAENYEQETDEKMKLVTSLLEPVMILTIGLVIGGIVFAILLPIFQMDVLAN